MRKVRGVCGSAVSPAFLRCVKILEKSPARRRRYENPTLERKPD
jgi:hypothetical protein